MSSHMIHGRRIILLGRCGVLEKKSMLSKIESFVMIENDRLEYDDYVWRYVRKTWRYRKWGR